MSATRSVIYMPVSMETRFELCLEGVATMLMRAGFLARLVFFINYFVVFCKVDWKKVSGEAGPSEH